MSGRIHSVVGQLELRLVTIKHISRNWSTVGTKEHNKTPRVKVKSHLQLMRELIHPQHTVTSRFGHVYCLILSRLGQASHGHIGISNSFKLEDAAAFGDCVKGMVDSVQQDKDLRRFTPRTPCSETYNIYKHDRAGGEQVRNRLYLIHLWNCFSTLCLFAIIEVCHEVELGGRLLSSLVVTLFFAVLDVFLMSLVVLFKQTDSDLCREQRRGNGVGFDVGIVDLGVLQVIEQKNHAGEGKDQDNPNGKDDGLGCMVLVFHFLCRKNMQQVAAMVILGIIIGLREVDDGANHYKGNGMSSWLS
jgi:hypothetical protein